MLHFTGGTFQRNPFTIIYVAAVFGWLCLLRAAIATVVETVARDQQLYWNQFITTGRRARFVVFTTNCYRAMLCTVPVYSTIYIGFGPLLLLTHALLFSSKSKLISYKTQLAGSRNQKKRTIHKKNPQLMSRNVSCCWYYLNSCFLTYRYRYLHLFTQPSHASRCGVCTVYI